MSTTEQTRQPNPPAQDEADRQLEEAMLRSRMESIGLKILVLSGKGGVGKSTVAANLAVSLARTRRKVGLLDVDVHGPSIPKLLGLEDHPVQLDRGQIIPVPAGEDLAVMSIGLLLTGQADPVIWRGPRKHGVIRQFLKDVAWGRLDYLVIDSPPGTGDEPLSVAQLVGAPAGAVIVTTPQDLAIADVRRCVSFCRALSLPVLGIVENMSGFVCPACGHKVDLFKAGGGAALAEELHLPLLGQIPIDPQIVSAGDAGRPFLDTDPDGATVSAFADVVQAIVARGHEQADAALQPVPAPSADPPRTPKKESRMKIAIPLAGGRLSLHFGHCEEFAVVEVDPQSKQIVDQALHQSPPHEPGALPRWLNELGVQVILAGGMGQRAQQLLAASGIQVVIGAPAETPEGLVAAYLRDELQTGENICDH